MQKSVISKEIIELKNIAEKLKYELLIANRYFNLESRNEKIAFLLKNKLSSNYMQNYMSKEHEKYECIRFFENITQLQIDEMRKNYVISEGKYDFIGIDNSVIHFYLCRIIVDNELRNKRISFKKKTDNKNEKNINQEAGVQMFFEDEEDIKESRYSYVAVSGAYGSHKTGGGSFEMME